MLPREGTGSVCLGLRHQKGASAGTPGQGMCSNSRFQQLSCAWLVTAPQCVLVSMYVRLLEHICPIPSAKSTAAGQSHQTPACVLAQACHGAVAAWASSCNGDAPCSAVHCCSLAAAPSPESTAVAPFQAQLAGALPGSPQGAQQDMHSSMCRSSAAPCLRPTP